MQCMIVWLSYDVKTQIWDEQVDASAIDLPNSSLFQAH